NSSMPSTTSRRGQAESTEQTSSSRHSLDRSRSKIAEPKKRSSPIRAKSRSPSSSRRRRSRSRDDERRRRSRSRDREEKWGEKSKDRKRRRSRSRSKERSRHRRSRSPKKTRRDSSEITKKERICPADPIEEKEKEMSGLRAGGAYVPPVKMSSEQRQLLNWEKLKKRINGEINKVNVSNLMRVVHSLLQVNVVRGRGLLCKSILRSLILVYPGYADVFAALVAVVNSKFPSVGDLLIRRTALQFEQCMQKGEKRPMLIVAKFVAHLVNHRLSDVKLAVDMATMLLETPTDDSVEITIVLVQECGMKLQHYNPLSVQKIFVRLLSVLNEAPDLDKRTLYMIERAMCVLKDRFQAYPGVPELKLVEENDQVTHTVSLNDDIYPEEDLDDFVFDPDFDETEAEFERERTEKTGADDATPLSRNCAVFWWIAARSNSRTTACTVCSSIDSAASMRSTRTTSSRFCAMLPRGCSVLRLKSCAIWPDCRRTYCTRVPSIGRSSRKFV
ncbi:hypothetical protein PFISCL1PPCAC_25194, partial [Pristionchus fissidentatus]